MVCTVHQDLVTDVRELRKDVKTLLETTMRNRILIVFLGSTSAFGGSMVANQLLDNKNQPEVRHDTFDVSIRGELPKCYMDGGPDGAIED